MAEKERKPKDDKKIGAGRFFAWNLRGVSTGVCLMMQGYLTLYCSDTLGLNIGIVSMLLVVSKVIDAITDMAAGLLIDRTNTRIGRGRPYELSIIGLWICTYLMFSVPEGWTAFVKYVWILLMYISVNAVFNTLLNANGTAYMVRAFRFQEQYVKLNTYGFVVPMLGVAAFNIAFPTLVAKYAVTHAGWSRLVGIFAIFMTIIGILRFIFVPETNKDLIEASKKKEKVRLKDVGVLFRNDKYIFLIALVNLMLNFSTNIGVGSYYFKYIVGNLGALSMLSAAQVVALPLAFVIPQLLKKTTTARIIVGGIILTVAAGVVNTFAGANVPMLMIGGFLGGIGTVPCTMLLGLLLIDCADYNEYMGIQRMEGTLSAVNGFASKVGAAAATGICGILLNAARFVSSTGTVGVVQPQSAISMIRALFTYVPAALWAVTGFAMSFYKLDRKMPKIREELEVRRAAAKEETNG